MAATKDIVEIQTNEAVTITENTGHQIEINQVLGTDESTIIQEAEINQIVTEAQNAFEEAIADEAVMEIEINSVNNNNEEEAANQSVLQRGISFEMPSQQLQTIDTIFSLGGQEYYLNNCGSKRLVIGITSASMPNLQINFKLHDLKNSRHVSFSKKTWDLIVRRQNEILSYINHRIQCEVFDNNRIRVGTQILYNNCCVQFHDVNETCVSMMPPTFIKMMSLIDEVENTYIELLKKKVDVAKRIKLFMDISFFHLFKSNNIDNRHSYNWMTLYMNQSTNFLELSNSVANTWDQLGKWIANEQGPDLTDET